MGSYAEHAYSSDSNVTVTVSNGADNHAFGVSAQNAIVLQSYELSNIDSNVDIKATGKGTVFAQELRNGNRMQLDLCCNYTRTTSKSNMAVAEVEALTGFKFDEEEMGKLTGISDLQRVELDHDDTKMNIYFNPDDFIVYIRHHKTHVAGKSQFEVRRGESSRFGTDK
ncbi:unnamed protein product [Strongylus vulgaris]|uniref:Alpha-macroglobulin receptor-binding domain-containing protein n=1 Tax=Strongylus vulgaris TaxID=40348 RepID=A0A3P7K463_STRVU|nr:unnamed protein product [Strongylus vulgaris]